MPINYQLGKIYKLIDNKSVTDNNSVKNPKFFIIDVFFGETKSGEIVGQGIEPYINHMFFIIWNFNSP